MQLPVTLRYLGLPSALPPLPNFPLPSLTTLSKLLPSPTTIKDLFTSLPSRLQLKALRPLLPYSLAPTLFVGPILTGILEKTWPGQMYGRRLLTLKDGGVLDCLALAVPGFVRRGWNGLIGEKAEEEKSPAVERRRWVEMRNYIVVRAFSTRVLLLTNLVKDLLADIRLPARFFRTQGPITEELVFRSCIISTYYLAAFDKTRDWKSLALGTPCWFGLAHLHHAWEVYKKGGKTGNAAARAAMSAGFQFTYTTLFGWFAAYLFVKTGQSPRNFSASTAPADLCTLR